jgi:hypothetical protein
VVNGRSGDGAPFFVTFGPGSFGPGVFWTGGLLDWETFGLGDFWTGRLGDLGTDDWTTRWFVKTQSGVEPHCGVLKVARGKGC